MCKLLVGINFDKKKNKIVPEIIRAQLDQFDREVDGVACLIVRGSEAEVKKEVDEYDDVYSYLLKNAEKADLFGLHTRTATQGLVSQDNCHFYQRGQYIFAHNGFVGGFSSQYTNYAPYNQQKTMGFGNMNKSIFETDYEMEQYDKKMIDQAEKKEKSDSLMFLEKIPKNVSLKELEALAEQYSFKGVSCLYDKKRKKMFLLNTRDIEVHTDLKSYLIMYSYSPENELREQVYFKGLKLYGDVGEELETYKIPSGIFEFSFKAEQGTFEKTNFQSI